MSKAIRLSNIKAVADFVNDHQDADQSGIRNSQFPQHDLESQQTAQFKSKNLSQIDPVCKQESSTLSFFQKWKKHILISLVVVIVIVIIFYIYRKRKSRQLADQLQRQQDQLDFEYQQQTRPFMERRDFQENASPESKISVVEKPENKQNKIKEKLNEIKQQRLEQQQSKETPQQAQQLQTGKDEQPCTIEEVQSEYELSVESGEDPQKESNQVSEQTQVKEYDSQEDRVIVDQMPNPNHQQILKKQLIIKKYASDSEEEF